MALRLFSQELQNDLALASARGEAADTGAQAAREGLLARARARDPTLLPILSRALLEGIKPASPLVVVPQGEGTVGARAEAVKAEANEVLVWHLQNKALEALVEVWREGRGAKKAKQHEEEEGGGGGGGGADGGKEGGKETGKQEENNQIGSKMKKEVVEEEVEKRREEKEME